MKELFDAIKKRFDDTPAFAVSMPGGLFLGTADRDTIDALDVSDKTFMVVNLNSTPAVEYNTGRTDVQNVIAVISIFGTDDQSVMTARNLIDKEMVREGLSTTSADRTILAAFNEGESLTEDPDRTKSGKVVWQAVILIRFRVQRRF